jgi:hypothetical protein
VSIASHLQKGDYITQIDIKPLHPSTPEASLIINTKEPFKVLEGFSKDKCVKNFNLESPISENMQKLYSINMKVEYLCVQ